MSNFATYSERQKEVLRKLKILRSNAVQQEALEAFGLQEHFLARYNNFAQFNGYLNSNQPNLLTYDDLNCMPISFLEDELGASVVYLSSKNEGIRLYLSLGSMYYINPNPNSFPKLQKIDIVNGEKLELDLLSLLRSIKIVCSNLEPKYNNIVGFYNNDELIRIFRRAFHVPAFNPGCKDSPVNLNIFCQYFILLDWKEYA